MRRAFTVAAAALLAACNVEFAEPAPHEAPQSFIDVVIVDSVEFRVHIAASVRPASSRSGSAARILDDRIRLAGLEIQPFWRTNDLLRFDGTFHGGDALAVLEALYAGDIALPVVDGFSQPRVDFASPVRHGPPDTEPLTGGGLRLRTRWSQPHAARIGWQSGFLTLEGTVPAGTSVWPDPLPPSIDVTASALGPCSATPLVARLVAEQRGPQARSRSGYNVFTRTTLRLSWTIPHPCA